MTPLSLKLKSSELERIRHLLKVEEPVIRRANILNCLHVGYVSSDIALILNVDQKTVTNIGPAENFGVMATQAETGKPCNLMQGRVVRR